MRGTFERQRAALLSEMPVSLDVRRDRLGRALTLIETHGAALCAALARDHAADAPAVDPQAQLDAGLAALRLSIARVKDWMRPVHAGSLIGRIFGGGDELVWQPAGVVGVAVPADLAHLVTTIAGLLAAGNRAMLAYDRSASHLGSLLAQLLPGHFDAGELAIFPRDAGTGSAFADLPFDLLLEGGPKVDGAESFLSPHGKSPTVIGRSADLARAADQIVQAVLAPADGQRWSGYLLVPDDEEEMIASWLWRAARRAAPAAESAANPSTGSDRLIADAVQRGGEMFGADAPALPLHILRHASDDMLIMTQETPGPGLPPILPLRPYGLFDEAIAQINARPAPLAIYYMGRDKGERAALAERTRSGALMLGNQPLQADGTRPVMSPPEDEANARFRHASIARFVHH